MRRYRDKLIAHLDDDRIMQLPHLDGAKLAVEFYNRHVVDEEASPGDLRGLVNATTIIAGYDEEKAMASRAFSRAGK
jgi:hypothetical protein